MSVHYKFKSALEYDTVTFDGLHISVRDLKKAIIHQKRIGKSTDFDLQVTNAQTKEVYTDDNALIAKNTSLIIARVPLTIQQKKAWDRSEANQQREGKGDGDGQDPAMNRMSKTLDLASLDASEEDKIKAMMSQSTQDYNPINYIKVRGSNQVGEVPANYRCYKCHQPGHWIKNCPLGSNQEPVEIKKSTGIPRSFLVSVEGPGERGAMMTPSGQFAVPAVDHQAYKEGKRERPPFQAEPEQVVVKPEIPEDLLCSVCMDLLTDAVMVPCCGVSFCDECIRTVLIESEEHECPDCQSKNTSPNTLIPNRYLRTAVNNFRNKTGYVKPRPKVAIIVELPPPIPPMVVVAPPVEVLVDPLASEEDEALDPPGTQGMVEPPPEELLAEGQPITQLQHRPRHGGHHPLPPGTRYVGPPGMSGRPLPLPPHIQGHLTGYPHAGPRRHSMEDRPGTPTIDERLDALPDTSVPPPNCVPAGPYQPPAMQPQPIYPQDHRGYGPLAGPGYEPAHMMPFHHESSLGPSHYIGSDSDGRSSYRSGYRGRSRAPYPGPYRAGSGSVPPDRLPANGTQPGIPQTVIEDTLAVFERMLREKDERDRKRKARRSRSRSYTPRSRSRSRSYTRSRTRTPPPRKRERTRSRSFSISRSCSRSYSRSPGPRPPPRERERTRERERDREYSPQRRPERFRSPQRSPTRYHHPVPAGRGREFDYDEPEFTSFGGRQRGGGSDQRFAAADRKDKDYFNNHAGAAIRYPPEEPRYPRNSPPRDIHPRPNGPPGVRYDRYNNPIVSSSVRNYDGPRNFDGPRPFNGPRSFEGPPRHFDGPQRPYDGPPMNRPYDEPPTNRPYDDGPMNQRPYDDVPLNYRQHDPIPNQRQFDGPPVNRPYENAAPNPRPFDRRFDAFDEAPPGTGPDLPIPGSGANRYDRNFEREYQLTPPGEERSAWDEMDALERERAFFEMQTMGEDTAVGHSSPRKISRERDERREDRRGGEREDRRVRDEKRGEKDEKRPMEREQGEKRTGEKEERRGGNREEKRAGDRDGKRGSEREQYERDERRVSSREEKRAYERTRRGSGKEEKRERDEKYGKEREVKRAVDRDDKRGEKDDVRSGDKEEKQSRTSVKDVQKENLPEQKDVKGIEQDTGKENDHATDREKERKKDEKKSKDRKKKKKEKGDEDKKKKKRKGKKDGVDKKTEKKEKEKPGGTAEPVVPLETAEVKAEPPKEESASAEPTQSLYEDMEDAPIDPDVIATYKEVNETEGKADLAPLPELSKWEMDDEFTSPSEKKQGDAGTPDSASKVVTSEVLKRAENAIFQKAINAIRPSDQPKKAEKERKPESEVVKLERKEAEPPKSLDRERKGETSSRDRKTYSDRDDQPRADRERKDARAERDRGKPDRFDAKAAAEDGREARKTGNSIQITIPVEIPALLEMSLEPPAKLKGKLDRSKFSTANWTQKDDGASPVRVSAKDRLGARVDDLGRRSARSKSPSRKTFKSSVESTVTVSGYNRSYSPPPKLFKSAVEVKYDQNSRAKEGAYRQRSPHRDRRMERAEPDHWKDDRRYERPSDRRRHDSRDARDRSEDSRAMDVRDEKLSDRRRHDSKDPRDRSEDSRAMDVRDEKEEKVGEDRKDRDEDKKDKKKDDKHRTHKKGDSKNTRKRSTSDRERKKKDKKHKKVKERKKEKKEDDKKEKDPLQERELAANPERESEVAAAAAQKDGGDDSAKKPRKADRKKSTLDEASFEPDYGISSEGETEDDAEKKPVAAPEKEEVKTVAKKRSRSQDSESSSSSESSSESSDHHRKRHKRHKRKKSKKSTTEGSSSGSESNRSSSESEEKKRKSKKHHKRSKTKVTKKKKKSKH